MESIGIDAINYIDVIIAGTFLVFIIFGVVRGFTNDILSLMTWLGAAFITKEMFPFAQPFARQLVSEPFFSDVILGFVIFILSLIILVFIAKTISNAIRKSALSGVDRSLGIISGSLRSVVLLVTAYFVALLFFKTGQTPPEFQNARLIAAVHIPAQMAHKHLIPQDLFPNRLVRHLYGEKSVYKSEHDVQSLVKALSSPKPGQPPHSEIGDRTPVEHNKTASQKEGGYAQQDRQKLESMIQHMSESDAESDAN